MSCRQDLRILDIGSGLGGNTIGLLKFIHFYFDNIKHVVIDAVDGNDTALAMQRIILNKLDFNFTWQLNPVHNVFTESDFRSELREAVSHDQKYDFIMTSKFINEMYSDNKDSKSPYADFLDFAETALGEEGFIIVSELTNKVGTRGHINKVLNREVDAYLKNGRTRLSQVYPLPCYFWRNICQNAKKCFLQQKYLNGSAKISTMIFGFKGIAEAFYNRTFAELQKQAKIRVKDTYRNTEQYCYQGRLTD
ncbi:MAG: class I SAM-dependent methyltransferase [Thermodesulfobacteriota bacterium]|nr:class I SAM-dependent methyltransferase [Thermodesulfobacteriota bacterium]